MATPLRLLVPLCLTLTGCAGDPGGDDGSGTGDTGDSTDAGADSVVACNPTTPPADGDVCDCEGESYDGSVGDCARTCDCEFGFWACTDDCEEVRPVSLAWGTEPSLAEVDGDGDAFVNPGEVWAVLGAVTATNAPAEGASVDVRVESQSPFIDAGSARVQLTGVTNAAADFALEVTVLGTAPATTTALGVSALSGFAVLEDSLPVTITPAARAVLEWDDVELLTGGGAPAIRIEAGDALIARATLVNAGTLPAQGIEVEASSSSSSLSAGPAVEVGVLAPDARREVEIPITVSADPSDLEPTLTFAATAEGLGPITEVVAVPIYPPDRMEVLGHEWIAAGGADWDLVVEVHNAGRFPLTGLSWNRIDYVSPDIPEGSPGRDDPFYAQALGIGDPSGPSTLTSGGTADVTLRLTISGATPAIGRVLLQANGNERRHGPFPIAVSRPTP